MTTRTALIAFAAGFAVLLGAVAVLWWRRRNQTWVKDDDLMDLAESLGNPRARMPVEPTADARAGGAAIRLPNYHKEV